MEVAANRTTSRLAQSLLQSLRASWFADDSIAQGPRQDEGMTYEFATDTLPMLSLLVALCPFLYRRTCV
jgi:hypothetical protein